MAEDSTAPPGGGSSSVSNTTTGADILSSKVTRALEVRTDTAAMKAALEALSQLPTENEHQVIDSRSVRVAIEQDALHQALLMQDELKRLVSVVSELRKGVTDTAAIANRVSDAIDASVVTPSSSSVPTNTEGESKQEEELVGSLSNTAKPVLSPEEALELEQQLATRLSDAFRERDEAAKRAHAVNEFLNKFDLSEQDSRLLDHYAFEDMEKDGSSKSGMAFLDALERVRRIRTELGKTFGTTTGMGGLSYSETQQHEGSSSDAQRLGATSAIRMMESLASKQERAYERLYHWLQKHLHLNVSHVPSQQQQPVDQDSIDESLSHPFVRRSLFVLRNVPAFYAHTLELIATSRRSEETRRFLLALTSGYDGKSCFSKRQMCFFSCVHASNFTVSFLFCFLQAWHPLKCWHMIPSIILETCWLASFGPLVSKPTWQEDLFTTRKKTIRKIWMTRMILKVEATWWRNQLLLIMICWDWRNP